MSATIQDLQVGIYRLKQDVTNPDGDKRTTIDWLRAPVWKAGWRFEVRTDLDMPGVKTLAKLCATRARTKGLEYLVEHLELEPPSLTSTLVKHGWASHTNHWLVEVLMEHGGVTLEQIDAALVAYKEHSRKHSQEE